MEQSPPLIMSLPDDVIVNILARLSRSNYPNLSLVCKHFLSLLASPELYLTRSLLGCTEPCIYALLYNETTRGIEWYILHQKAGQKADGNNRLVFIPLLPDMPLSGSFVAFGSKIYVFGKTYDYDDDTSTTAFSIDCRFHTVQPLPGFPIPMVGRFADIIDEKIYVIGECRLWSGDWKKKVLVVFNTKTQMWEPGMTELEMEQDYIFSPTSVVVMADKMHMKDSYNSFVYLPKERKWEPPGEMLINSKRWGQACVVDDILYYYDCHNNNLRMYDPNLNCWEVVKGVGELLPETAHDVLVWSHTMNYGGKLLVFLYRYDNSCETSDIWCAEIGLERSQGKKIRGKVEWCDVVFKRSDFFLYKVLVVMV